MGNIVSTLNAIQLSLCFAPVADGNSSAHVQRHHKTHWLFYLFVLASIFPPRCLVLDSSFARSICSQSTESDSIRCGTKRKPDYLQVRYNSQRDILMWVQNISGVLQARRCAAAAATIDVIVAVVRIANNKHVNNNSFANVNSVGNGRHLWLAVEMDFLFLVISESNFLLSMRG